MTTKIYLIVLSSFLFSKILFADGILLSWSVNNIKNYSSYELEEAQRYSTSEIIQKNKEVQSWFDAYKLFIASKPYFEDKKFLEQLIAQIIDTSTIKMTGTNRLIIWERITSKDIFFEGKGYQVDDDLFSVAGRANWILRNLVKKNFGFVNPNSTYNELKILQSKWKDYLSGDDVKEYENPYENADMPVITSIEAVEALIVSLEPNKVKEEKTKECLKNLYKLDEMPEDKNSPAQFCNPDTYTIGWLLVLTADIERKINSEWIEWWEENKNNIYWNKENKIFEVRNRY